MSDQAAAPTVMVVCLAAGLGGSTRSVATVLAGLEGRATRVLVGSPRGRFPDLVREKGLAELHLTVAKPQAAWLRRLSRLWTAVRVAAWAWRHRDELVAIHANGPEEVNVAAPAVLLSGARLVVWSHAWGVPPSSRVLGRIWRRLLRRRDLRFAAVSPMAAEVLAASGLVDVDDVAIVGNPIDPADVVAPPARDAGVVSIGFVGNSDPRKGVQFLPVIAADVEAAPVRWLLFTNPSAVLDAALADAAARGVTNLSWEGFEPDVGKAYARCDIVIAPSLKESFCRVAVEAMANGLPVVATDLPPVRALVGDGEAGLLFPAGDTAAAAAAVTRLVDDAALRAELGARGREKAGAFRPQVVVDELAALYGLD